MNEELFTDSPAPKADDSLFTDAPAPSTPGQLESLGRGAANNFPLMPQAIAGGEALFGDKGYSENLEDWNKKAAAAKAAHPVVYGAGAVGGAIAPLFIPGVGEALEAAPIAGNAALGAANAISNRNLSQDLTGNLKEAAKGAGIGAGTAWGLGKVADVFGNAGNRIEANATANALDMGTFGIKKLARTGENPEEVMLGINKDINEKLPGLVNLSDTASSKLEKVMNAHEAAGKTIGSVVDSVSQMGGTLPEGSEAIEELEKAASKYNGLTSARNADAKAELTDAATRLRQLQEQGALNFRALADMKTDIGHAYHNPNFQNHGIDQAYGILSDKIDNILDRISVDDPAIKPHFDQAKDVYRLTSKLIPAMSRGAMKEVAGAGGGLTNAALGAGAIFGHPAVAAGGYALKTAAKLAAPDFAPNLAYKAVNAARNGAISIPGLKQGATQALIDALVSKFGKGGQ